MIILLISGLIDFTVRTFFRDKNLRFTISVLLTMGCIFLSYWGCDWTYFEKQTELSVETAKKYAGLDCIIVNDGVNFWNHTLYYEAINYNSLTFLSSENLDVYTDTTVYQDKPVIVYIMDILENQEELLQKLLKQNPSYTHITDSHYANGYLLE